MRGKALIALMMSLFVLAGLGLALAQEEGLKIADAVICTAVTDRTPEGAGESFPADVGELFCFTRVTGAKGEVKIKHLWYQGDNLLAEVELNVKSANWRTWSSKNIEATRKGAWKVEVQDADGNILKTLNFTIE